MTLDLQKTIDRSVLQAEIQEWQVAQARLLIQLDTQIEIGERLGRDVKAQVKQLTDRLEEVKVALEFLRNRANPEGES